MKQNPLLASFTHLLLSGTFVHEGTFEALQASHGTTLHPNVVVVVSIDRYPELVVGQPDEWRTEIGHVLVEAIEAVVTFPYTWSWTEEGVLALSVDGRGRVAVEGAKRPGTARCTNGAETGISVNPGTARHADIHASLKVMSRQIQVAALQRGISVSIGIGGVYESPKELHHSYREAVQAMSERFFQGKGLIFVYGEDRNVDEVLGDILTAEKTELVALVRIGDEVGVMVQLRALLDALAKECRYNEAMFRSEVVDIVMLVTRSVIESGVSASAILTQNAHFIRELYATIRYDKFVGKVCDYVQWLTSEVRQMQWHALSPIIRKAVHFMQQNHKENLALEDVSRHCAMSKYHLSHLFKKETGVGVIEFLNHIRMEKAVVYLQTTDLPIQQIAGHVGFEDANYFSRIFKKYKGMSPRDFRCATLC